MNDDPKTSQTTPQPAAETDDNQHETVKVDTKVQEEAAKDRAESGGYD